MRILILTGGRIDTDFALSFLDKESFEHIIVVDGALEFWDKVVAAHNKNAVFDHLVGDFDTVSHSILDKYVNCGNITVHRFKPEKDNTDTDIAVRLAKELGGCGAEVVMLGATGSRIDHTLANIYMLYLLDGMGLRGVIVDSNNRIRLIKESFTLKKTEAFGEYISIIPISDSLEGVTLAGFKYLLNEHRVYMGDSLCVSNELVDEFGEISIKKGLALLIESRD